MSKEFVRRDILKMGMGAAACAAVGVLGATSPAEAAERPAILFCARESSPICIRPPRPIAILASILHH